MVARSDAIENELVTQRSNTEAQIARLSDQLKTSEAKMSVDLDRLAINIDATLKKNQTLTRESISATSDNLYLEQKKQGDKIDKFMGRQEQQNQNLLALIQQTAETQRQIVLQSKQREIEIDNRLSNKDTHLELARTSGQNSQNQIDMLFQLVEKIRLDLTAAVGDGQHLSQQTQLSFEKRFAESRAQAQMELQQRMNDSAAQVQLAYEKAMKEASDAAMARQEAWQREMQVTQASDMTKINELLQTKLLEIMRVATQVTPSKDTPAKRTASSTTTTTTKMSTKTKSQPPSTAKQLNFGDDDDEEMEEKRPFKLPANRSGGGDDHGSAGGDGNDDGGDDGDDGGDEQDDGEISKSNLYLTARKSTRDLAFNGTTWSDEQRFHELMQSITGNAKTFAQDSKSQQPTTSYKEMVKRLNKNYPTHLTQLQLTQLMQKSKRWEMTWSNHLTYLHHVQSMANVSNEFVLDCLTIHACPSKKDELLAHINPANKNTVEEQTKLIGILTRTAGTGINHGKRKHPPPAAANVAMINKPKDNKKPAGKSKDKANDKPAAKATRICGICKDGNSHFFSDCPIVKMGQEAKAKQGQTTGSANLTTASSEKGDVVIKKNPAMASYVIEEMAAGDDDDFNVVHTEDEAVAHRCTNPGSVASTEWICDSGCTHHLTNDEAWISDPVSSNLRVRVANSTVIEAASKGSATLTLLDGRQIRLQEVHYVPSLQSNLLSISTLNRNKIDVKFGATIDFVDRSTGAILLHGSRNQRFPVLECMAPPTGGGANSFNLPRIAIQTHTRRMAHRSGTCLQASLGQIGRETWARRNECDSYRPRLEGTLS
ncbi:hypothetical protein Ae201684P_019860 [Aphanomyces euteiches]|nr:hypothetical protein Ae201684P_019460 [Aphanomyces euteiches]KAH9078786.1 hypothetical protein Ae201684P_019860 [Aphanomyces euteiches]